LTVADEEGKHDIRARPTKEFFVKMLTKDIRLGPAIIDLIDNSIDGARRLRGEGGYDGLRIDVTVTPGRFAIEDNCGGIEVELAKKVAFRFGRDEETKGVPGSIGVVGVGMKRALFKIAKEFKIESVAPRSSFTLHLNVEQWKNLEDWDFDFDESTTDTKNPIAKTGTTITVDSLLEDTKEDFSRESFLDELFEEVREKEEIAIENGIQIRVNGDLVEKAPKRLLRSTVIVPAFIKRIIGENGGAVRVKIYAGITRSERGDDPQEAGWYVYCNSRQIVGGDQTEATGWGQKEWGEDIPLYHNQFSWFRGYAFFESDLGERLPWNTTKTELDQSSPVLREVREDMAALMRPVIDFLNDIDKEKPFLRRDKTPNRDTPLTAAVYSAKNVELRRLRLNQEFLRPTPARKVPERPHYNIGYFRPQAQIDELAKVFKVRSNKAVGEKTFDYTYKRERRD